MAPLLPLPAIGQPGTDVDEPLNNLDLRHAVELMRLLRRMSSELGRTVVLVVHDVNVASCYSDRIVAMRNRRVLAAGPTEELMVAELLGEVFDVDVPVHSPEGRRIAVPWGVIATRR
jgi:iron complex transport system ATP-binding protein